MSAPAVGSPFTPIRPRKAWFAVPAVLALAGVATAVALVVGATVGAGPQRVVVPGAGELRLDEGAYRIYYEYRSEIDGERVFTGYALPPLDVTVRSAETGDEIALDVPAGRHTYESGSPTRWAGYSILAFEIAAPGTYLLEADYGAEPGPDAVVLAVRRTGQFLTVAAGAALGIVAVVVAIGLAVFIDVRRGRARAASRVVAGGPPPA